MEDYLLDQIKEYNRIGSFIEYFVEQAYQLGMIDKKRTRNMKDREKS